MSSVGFRFGVVFFFRDFWDAKELFVVVGLMGELYNPLQNFFITVSFPQFTLLLF